MRCTLLAATVSPQTRPRRFCSLPRIRRASSPGSSFRSTAGSWPAGSDRLRSRQRPTSVMRPAPDPRGAKLPFTTSLPFPAQPHHERTIPVGTDVQKKLFTPVQVGPITLKHRIVMPPMSRLRAQWPSGIPSDLMREYYSQRPAEGGLILTEATAISRSGRGYRGAPCLYSDEQVTGWNRITDAVHAKGGHM